MFFKVSKDKVCLLLVRVDVDDITQHFLCFFIPGLIDKCKYSEDKAVDGIRVVFEDKLRVSIFVLIGLCDIRKKDVAESVVIILIGQFKKQFFSLVLIFAIVSCQ